jgi:CheY-like chemotaxis protein
MHTPTRRNNILIIEDDPFYRTLYVGKLKQLGSDIRLVTSGNGYSALLSLGEQCPDLVILDLDMPRFDGVSFLEVVKSNPAYRNLPILVISGEIDMLPNKGKDYPHTYVFEKPLQAQVFDRIVHLALNIANHSIAVSPDVISGDEVDIGHMTLYVGHDRTLQRAIAEQFVSLAGGRIVALQQAVAQRDFGALRHFCHGMESISQTIGAHALARIVKELNAAAKDADMVALERLGRECTGAIESFCAALSQEFSLKHDV